MDDGPWVYYKLTYEPLAQGSGELIITTTKKSNFTYNTHIKFTNKSYLRDKHAKFKTIDSPGILLWPGYASCLHSSITVTEQ